MCRLSHAHAVVCAAIATVFLLAGGLVGAAPAEDVYVDVAVNGHTLHRGALIHGDRTYVALADVARVFDGRAVYDRGIKVAFVHTDRYAGLFYDTLLALNPNLEMYRPMSPPEPGMGVRFGVSGPHLAVTTTPAGVVASFELVLPQGAVHHRPWFDQQRGEYENLPGVGLAYTQQLVVMDPDLIRSGGRSQVVLNGQRLNISADAMLWQNDRLFIRLRDLAEASGGGVGWDRERRIASAKIVPGDDLTYDTLLALNPTLDRYYEQLFPDSSGMGDHYGVEGPSIAVGLDDGGQVALFEAYNQRIYLVDPSRMGR